MITEIDVTLAPGNLKRIHVHTGKMQQFRKDGLDRPCVIVRAGGKVIHGRTVEIEGPSRMIQSLERPMPGCGARIWIETRAKVRVAQATMEAEVCDA